ncbi:rhomboid family intramembrane serine protease [Acidobacteria bacterium AH-259-A15]|nr:rhomboid family intramembrane serine protease [Acidobacteria bacterium AH-259-A15]
MLSSYLMRYGPRSYVTMGPTLTPMVKKLVIVSAATFLLQGLGAYEEMLEYFGLIPYLVLSKLHLWRIGTYLFLHGGFWHLFWNMFALWMFGCELERYWGSREFLRFFLITGIGAGLLSILFQPFSLVPTIGASGAIYGILMAYGMMFPERLVYLYFLFPVKVKYFVGFLGAITFFSAFSSPGGPIAHMAHVGGMVFAFLYLKGWLSISGIRQAYYRWRLRRMRRRFKVYDSEERKREDDFWIN